MAVLGVLARFEWDVTSRTLGNMWRLQNGVREMSCLLVTHPLGWELRVSAGDELLRSEVCRTETDVFDVAERWEAEAVAKGWIRT